MDTNILSDLVITKVYSASTMYTLANVRAKKKDRPCWAVVSKYEGETVYTANGKRFLSDASHMILLPKGCSYEWECTESGHFSILEFESALTYPYPLVFPVRNGERILRMLQDLEYKRNLKRATVEMESIRDAYSILLTLAQSGSERYLPSEKQKKIAPAIAYISQNYNKNLTNGELAALTGLSTVYFRKLFTQLVGMSPITYAHALRIGKAKEMLKSDYGTLSDVARSLGYSSLYHFSKDFKKHTGVSPSRY